MNCHENNKRNHGTHKHSPLKHMLHMVLCCGLPIVIVGLLPIITKFNPGAGSLVSRIVPYLCPIMMISMIVIMMSGGKKENCCDNKDENHKSNEVIIDKQ